MARQSTIDAFLGSKLLRKPLPRAVSNESIMSCITVNNEMRSTSAEDIASTPPTSIDGGSSTGLASLDPKQNYFSTSSAPATVTASSSTSAVVPTNKTLQKKEDTENKQQQQQQPMARSRRARSGVVTYNENALIRNTRAVTIASSTPAQRDLVGNTLAPPATASPSKEARDKLVQDGIQALDLDWQVDALPGETMGLAKEANGDDAKKKGVARSRSLLRKASAAIEKTKSVLGKRTREIIDVGKSEAKDVSRRASLRARNLLQQAENKDDAAAAAAAAGSEEPDAKKRRTSKAQTASSSAAPATTNATTQDKPSASASETKRKPTLRARMKRYHREGLYIGQETGFDPRFKPGDNSKRAQKARAKQQEEANGTTSSNSNSNTNTKEQDADTLLPPKKRSILPLPMWAGRRLITNGRDFKMPFDVFNPLPPGQPKPDEWRKTARNVFIGDAADIWKTSKRGELSTCVCTDENGCDDGCFNRFMFYECDKDNCCFGPEHCSNRAFEDLRRRVKKGGKYNIGVEVMKTDNKGYGVRSCRSFQPGQIIVEYTGEIITQDECDHRTRTIYKDNECFYLMMFDQNMIIDATRGSIARFVNHSCEPNCRMVKWTVEGKPRMALFAGDAGIVTGEELTYDYNFDPFSAKNIQECHCGMASCRGVLGPRPGKETARDGNAGGGGGGVNTHNNHPSNTSSTSHAKANANSNAASSSLPRTSTAGHALTSAAKRKLKDAVAEVKSKKRRLSAGASSMLAQVRDAAAAAAAKKEEEEEKKESRAARAALRADIKSARSSRLVAAKLTKKRQPVVSATKDRRSGKVTVKVGKRTTATATAAATAAAAAVDGKGKGTVFVASSSPARKTKAKAMGKGMKARAATAALGSLGGKAARAGTGTMRRNVDSVRSNVVRTIRGAASGRAAGARGKTIKVVQADDDVDEEVEEGDEGEETVVVGGAVGAAH